MWPWILGICRTVTNEFLCIIYILEKEGGKKSPQNKLLLFMPRHNIKCSDSQATEPYLLEPIITKTEWSVIQLTMIQYILHDKSHNLKQGYRSIHK